GRGSPARTAGSARTNPAQNPSIGTQQPSVDHGPLKVQNGGSACGYQELSAPLAIPTTAEQAGVQAVCLCIGSAGRERPLLPLRARPAFQILVDKCGPSEQER